MQQSFEGIGGDDVAVAALAKGTNSESWTVTNKCGRRFVLRCALGNDGRDELEAMAVAAIAVAASGIETKTPLLARNGSYTTLDDRNALLVAVGALVLMATGSTGLALGKRSAVMRFTARVTFVEIVPLVIFSYVYFAWSGATGRTLSLIAIVAVIGGLIAGFQFWKWSRDLGDEPSERIYFISWPRVRVVLVLLTMLAAGFNALLYSEANLSIAYLIYELAVCAVFAYVLLHVARPMKPSRGGPDSAYQCCSKSASTSSSSHSLSERISCR